MWPSLSPAWANLLSEHESIPCRGIGIDTGKGQLLSSLPFKVLQCPIEHWVPIVWEGVGRKIHKLLCLKVLDYENWFIRLSLQQPRGIISCRGLVTAVTQSPLSSCAPLPSTCGHSKTPLLPLYPQSEAGQPVPRDQPVEPLPHVQCLSSQ